MVALENIYNTDKATISYHFVLCTFSFLFFSLVCLVGFLAFAAKLRFILHCKQVGIICIIAYDFVSFFKFTGELSLINTILFCAFYKKSSASKELHQTCLLNFLSFVRLHKFCYWHASRIFAF